MGGSGNDLAAEEDNNKLSLTDKSDSIATGVGSCGVDAPVANETSQLDEFPESDPIQMDGTARIQASTN